MKYLPLIFALCISFLLSACSSDQEESRHFKTETSTSPVYIGIAWPQNDENLFLDGIKLAAKEMNEAGGFKGRRIELVFDGRESIIREILLTRSSLSIGENIKEYAREIARDFSNDPRNIVAIVGHRYSFLAISAGNIYQQKHRVFVAPTATGILLTTLNFDYVFRMLPNNEMLGQQLARFAASKGYFKVGVIYERSEYAQETSIAFTQEAAERFAIHAVSQDSFFTNLDDRLITDLAVKYRRLQQENPIDAIFIFTSADIAGAIYQEFRRRGLTEIPFVGAETLDTDNFWNRMKAWQKVSGQPSLFSAPTVYNHSSPANTAFIRRFEAEFGNPPDRYAAIGYDSLKTLIEGMRQADSTDPTRVADELRYMGVCAGVTGRLAFTDNGDPRGKVYYMKELTLDGFKYKTLDDETVDDKYLSIFEQCADADHDNDGVVDDLDKCPENTPEELVLGVFLKGEFSGCPIDNDNDGIPDYRDDDPNTPPESQRLGVDEKGKPLDSDKDGIPDYLDDSPNDDPEKVSAGVDEKGKPLDSDKDGVPDYRDDCPNDTKGTLINGVDLRGCPPDIDGDGVPNFWDQCPNNTPEEIERGVNRHGCPQDTDRDGVADYCDNCMFNTPESLEWGVDQHGCPLDTDNDGVLDYLDECPLNDDEDKLEGVDKKGCPTDTDDDGVPNYKDECPYTVPNVKVEPNGCVALEISTFPSDRSFSVGGRSLTSETEAALAEFVKTLNLDLIQRIEIIAHTDGLGSEEFNRRLSEQRAGAIADVLVNLGVPRHLITTIGAGESEPIAPNDTEANRALNRRFELRVKKLSHSR